MAIKISYQPAESYNAADLTAQWDALMNDGVFSGYGGSLYVTANSPAAMNVKVSFGGLSKGGLFFHSDAVETVSITANTSGYNRIDIIVADTSDGTIKAVAGTPSSSPTAPLPTATQSVLAQIMVGNNVSVINTENIIDKRTLATAKTDTSTCTNMGVSNNGILRLDNGYLRQWGTYPMSALVSDAGTGGYTTTITFNVAFVGDVKAHVSAQYSGGYPKSGKHSISATELKIGSDVNVSGGYLHWSAEGKWK